MSLINVNIGLLAYQDKASSIQPLIRLADIKWSLQGIQSDNFRNVPISLSPGETLTIASTARTLPALGSVTISKSGNKMKIQAPSGTFRAHRVTATGDASTRWALTRSGDICRLSVASGTQPDWSIVQPGDGITLESGFQAPNQDDFVVLSATASYIDFRYPFGLDESNVDSAISIYSSGPVQVGDILDITSSAFSYVNRGAFAVTRVTDSVIEAVHPDCYPENVSSIMDGIAIYPYAYKWMAMAVDRKALVGLNASEPSSIEVEPLMEGNIQDAPGLFIKRGKVFEVRVKNPGLHRLEGFLILAE
jgi:hypothetical protein